MIKLTIFVIVGIISLVYNIERGSGLYDRLYDSNQWP